MMYQIDNQKILNLDTISKDFPVKFSENQLEEIVCNFEPNKYKVLIFWHVETAPIGFVDRLYRKAKILYANFIIYDQAQIRVEQSYKTTEIGLTKEGIGFELLSILLINPPFVAQG